MKDIFKVLADKNRRKIVKILLDGQLSVNELLCHFSIKQATLSAHLAVLFDAGLVNVFKKSKYRFYSINESRLEDFVREINLYFRKNVKRGIDMDFFDIKNMSRR